MMGRADAAMVGRCRLMTVLKLESKARLFQLLKLKSNEALSNIDCNFNLRGYTMGNITKLLLEREDGIFPASVVRSGVVEPIPKKKGGMGPTLGWASQM
jgi:hypothetical protein